MTHPMCTKEKKKTKGVLVPKEGEQFDMLLCTSVMLIIGTLMVIGHK